jgi:hypothetical protein
MGAKDPTPIVHSQQIQTQKELYETAIGASLVRRDSPGTGDRSQSAFFDSLGRNP